MTSKYTPAAERWSETQYADPVAYLRHRAELVVSLGPRLTADDTLLDLACGDGGLADFLPCRYVGVDSDEAMVEAARRRGVEAHLGDLNEFEPDEPVAAAGVFRAIYYAHDRLAFLRKVAAYTTKKLVFDLNPRQYRLDDVRTDLRRAGFERIALRPFFVPQTVALPGPVAALLRAAGRTGPLARVVLRFRFTYIVAASRSPSIHSANSGSTTT